MVLCQIIFNEVEWQIKWEHEKLYLMLYSHYFEKFRPTFFVEEHEGRPRMKCVEDYSGGAPVPLIMELMHLYKVMQVMES